MVRFLADEDIRRAIVSALRARIPALDIVRVHDVGLDGKPDPIILQWAATENRIVLTHDANTMTEAANQRLRVGLNVPGVVIIPQGMAVGQVIATLELAIVAGMPGDWDGQVRFLSL